MKKILAIALLSSLHVVFAQSNDCSTATTLSVTANCSAPLSGTTTGATQSIAGCTGTADDDVWYQFTATSTTHQITVTPSASLDPVVQVFSGTCSSLVSQQCVDLGFAGETEIVNLTGLTAGQVYRVRVYHYDTGSGSGTFSICCTVGAPAPANNNCSGATTLTVNTACSPTSGTTYGATQSVAGCAGTADDDVWYQFTATNAVQTITVTPVTSTFDAVFQVYSGPCGSLTSEACIDQTFMNDPESSQIVGLTPGQVYYIRVYDYYANSPGNFTICVTGAATATPTNDNPCSAIQLPAVTSNCNYLEFTTVGATNTTTPGAPSATCVNWNNGSSSYGTPTTGGFSASTLDVWFAITVPSSGNIVVTPKPNMGAGSITDGVMVLYTGTCSSLTQIACTDDQNFPGSANDLQPLINQSGLTPGSTVYLRYYGYGSTSGTFGLCVTTATNDACSNALYICDLNGYSASTSAAYTADRPCNMRGNAEQNNPPTYTYTPGTNQGGIFGSAGSWGTGSPAQDVQINNNSWIRFTAASATATLNVSVSDCWVGSYPSGGIQMQIFSSNGACCNFTPVSNFEESSSNFTITANSLTAGSDYYLMVDGYAGDICNYTISAQSGVQFPQITPVAPICAGQSVNLTAPAGASSYSWTHNGSTSQSVTVTPPTTQTYSVDVFGICGYKQTLTTTVTVNPIPAAPTVGPNQTLCVGQTLNLTASSAASSPTYSWTGPNGFTSNLQNPSISNVSTLNAGTYTCTVSSNGCVSLTSSVTVTINTIPAAPVLSSNSPVCVGQTINLFSNTIANATYSWTGPSSFASSLEDPTRASAIAGFAGTYSCVVTVNGCASSAGTTAVVVNANPAAPIASSNSPICAGTAINLTASTISTATYSWTGPNSFNSSLQNPTIGSSTTAMSGTYTVTATVNGCTSSGATTTVTVNPIPATPTVSSNSPVCQGNAVNLSTALVSGATYTWTGPNSFSSALQNPSVSNAQAVNAGTYNLTVTVNGCTSAIGSGNVNVNTAATVDAGNNLASCNGSAVTLGGSFGGGASSVTWSGGAGTYSNINSTTSTYTPTLGETGAGSVVLTLTTNDPAGPCPAVTDVVTITISSSPSASFSYSSNTLCQSATDPTPVYPIGASGGTFSSTGGLVITPSTGLIDVSASTPGTYTVTNFIAANGSCPSATATAPFTVVATPATPTASNNGLTCEGGTISLSTPTVNTATYSWSGPNGFNSSLQNPTISGATVANAGTYTVNVTVNGCPSANGTTTVAITPNPNVSILEGNTAALCAGSSMNLTATGASTYVWNTTETNSSISISPTVATVYSVTGTTNGCSSIANIAISINDTATINVAPTASPSNCDTPTGSLIGLTVNGTPSYNYVWTDASGNSVGITADVTNLAAGSYFVAVTDGNGCIAHLGPFDVSNFPSPSAPTVSFDDNTPCVNGSVLVQSSTVVGATSYFWFGPNNLQTSGQSFTIDPVIMANSGSYCVVATVNGCPSDTGCAVLTVNTIPTIDLTASNADSSACEMESIQLNASGGSTYSWSGPNGYSNVGASIQLNNLLASQSGYYFVTGTNGNNCSNSDSILVTVHPTPPVSISGLGGSNNFCSGSSLNLQANGGSNYTWSGPNNFNANGNTVFITFGSENASGTYVVSGSDNFGCVGTDSVLIQVSPSDFAALTGDTEYCPGETILLSGTGGGTYQWFGPNGFTANTAQVTLPGINPSMVGTYQLIVTDSLGCLDTTAAQVSIVITKDCLTIPELVTPDGDGHNDTWDIPGLSSFPDAEVFIYNRWGNLIYQVKPYTTPWNGEPNEGLTIDGNSGKVPFGTYFYLIRLNDENKTEYKGYLELQY